MIVCAGAWLLCGCACALAQITIDTPRAGWRHSAGERASFVQPVYYPASRVNTEGADVGTLITGRIAGASKPAATLVVNGVAVRDGPRRVRRQFYDAYAGKVPARLRVVLSWDTDATDVDLHVVSPTGEHAWYGDRVTPSGGAIDVDVTTGFGPEIFAHPSPPHGVWQIYVNYYAGGMHPENGAPRAEITTAQVAILTDEGSVRERQQVFRVPLRKPGELLHIRSFVYP
jgi:uncharacterized protein YfaP (DUF2135 family)